MADDQKRSRCYFLKQLSDAFGHHREREDGIANPRFVLADRPIQHVPWHSAIEGRFGPAPFGVVARQRDQQDARSLREILAQARAIERIDEELVPIGRAAVDDRQRRQRRVRCVGR
ncbi:MAG: hypothetical protein ACRD2A_26140, partial [Vicinamibacterales bacterium]